MPFNFNDCDCSPLVIDNEFYINDEDILAQHVGKIVLGHFAHVKRIILTLSTTIPITENFDIEIAIKRLSSTGKEDKDIEKRDGWVFQIISWLALIVENKEKRFYCQQPHDAPAQHGLDGIAVILNNTHTIENIIVCEDKCTENHRVLIPRIWEEFSEFERGDHNNKLVSRISALIEQLDEGNVLEANLNSIYSKNIRKYRVGINRNNTYQTQPQRKKLFKGYDSCVSGIAPHRRFASTFYQDDIRDWMEQFSLKVIKYLETQKKADV